MIIFKNCLDGNNRSLKYANRWYRGGQNLHMRDYHLHELGTSDFEALVISIASRILGIGVTSFSSGPDGGRDGRFVGTASRYPSETEQWAGRWVIQAKHTENPIATCNDRAFNKLFENDEIPRIKRLHSNRELDVYILATNRKKSGGADQNLTETVRSVIGHDKIGILGLEDISRHLDDNREIADKFNLNANRSPLRFKPSELAELIDNFVSTNLDYQALSKQGGDFDLTKLDEKNILNNVSDELAESIEDDSMLYFDSIRDFLGKGENYEIRLKYYALANEIKQKLIAENATSVGLATALSDVYDGVVSRHPEITLNRQLVTVFLHYMYYTCDIGRRRARSR